MCYIKGRLSVIENRDLSLLYMDGTYEGCVRCEFDGYHLVAYKIPHSDFGRKKLDCEVEALSHSSIYMLFGCEDGRQTVYIGQAASRKNGNAALQRIQEPHSSHSWDTAVILTTKDNHLDRSALCFLENLFYNKAKSAATFTLVNAAEPSSDHSIKAREIRILEKYAEYVTLLVRQLGYDVFGDTAAGQHERGKTDTAPDTERGITKSAESGEKIIFYCRKRGALASGYQTDDGFVVSKGSLLTAMERTPSCPEGAIKALKEAESIIRDNRLIEDITFRTPSAASNFVLQSSTNGMTSWQTKDGTTYGDYYKLTRRERN